MTNATPWIDERPLLQVQYGNRRVLQSVVNRGAGCVEMFVPVPMRAEERVRVRVSFKDTGKNFYIAGRATPARTDPEDGFFLLIEAPEERRAFQHLWTFCTALNQEQARRFEASIACSVRAGQSSFAARILDLSRSGAFVAAEPPTVLSPGSPLTVRVPAGPLGLFRRDISAHLVWQGMKSDTLGLGVEFADGGKTAMDLLRRRLHLGK